MSKDSSLSPKWEDVYKQIMKHYDTKQYKKGIKNASELLKVYPNHGETLALKGLCLSQTDKKEWGEENPLELAKRGVLHSMRSHVSWHVLGLIHRGEQNYAEATKCYINALKYDSNNLQILRDLATLQNHLLDTAGLIQTREKLLEVKPDVKVHWLGLAVAHHLAGNHNIAYLIICAFEKATSTTESRLELSKLQLYKIQLLVDGGLYTEAYAVAKENGAKVLDKLLLFELQVHCETKLSMFTEARQTFIKVLNLNPHSSRAIKEYLNIAVSFPLAADVQYSELTASQRKEILSCLDELNQNLLKAPSKTIARYCLDVTEGTDFETRLITFARPYVEGNIPSLFSALKSLYARPQCIAAIESLFLKWKEDLRIHGALKGGERNPTLLLFIHIFLAQHFTELGDYERALAEVAAAKFHSPTFENVYTVEAKIKKRQGNLADAADLMLFARNLDASDRYLTNRTVKYLLRANNIEKAAAVYEKFIRTHEKGVLGNLKEFEVTWYEIELADALRRLGDLRSALQTYLLVDNTFRAFKEDQFDFHNYCLRKYALRAYTEMINSKAFQHPFHKRALYGIVECYLEMSGTNFALLEESVIPYLRQLSSSCLSPLGPAPELSTLDLTSSLSYLKILETHAEKELETHYLGTLVYYRMSKFLLAMKAACKGMRITGAKKNRNFLSAVQNLLAIEPQGEVLRGALDHMKAYIASSEFATEVAGDEVADLLPAIQKLTLGQNA